MTPRVVIIGGGPAGLAAAIVLGRHDVPTLLVERHALPADKACGEGLLPNAVEALEGLGISRASLAAVGRSMAGVRYCSPKGRWAEGRFAKGTGFGVRRTHLARLLMEQARRWPSIEIVTGVRADLQATNAGWLVSVDDRRVSPSLVIAADGLGSRTRTTAGIASSVGVRPRWGMRQHLGVAPWSDCVEVHFGRGFEVYVTPLDQGINLAVLWVASTVDVPPSESAVLEMARRLPQLAARLEGARPISRVQAAGPFGRRAARRSIDGLLLLGDAAGYLDAITGEGVGLALLQAEMLERHVAPRLRSRAGGAPLGAADLAAFTRAVDKASRPNRQLTQLMLWIARRPFLVERTIALLDVSPALFAHALQMNMGGQRGGQPSAGK